MDPNEFSALTFRKTTAGMSLKIAEIINDGVEKAREEFIRAEGEWERARFVMETAERQKKLASAAAHEQRVSMKLRRRIDKQNAELEGLRSMVDHYRLLYAREVHRNVSDYIDHELTQINAARMTDYRTAV